MCLYVIEFQTVHVNACEFTIGTIPLNTMYKTSVLKQNVFVYGTGYVFFVPSMFILTYLFIYIQTTSNNIISALMSVYGI